MSVNDVSSEEGSSGIALGFINVNSITAHNKLDEIGTLISDYTLTCLGIAESKLDNTVKNYSLKIQDFYTPIRRDKTRTSGGILVYIRNNVSFKRLHHLENSNECIWLEINTCNSKFLLSFYYRNPNQTAIEFNDFCHHLNNSLFNAKQLGLPIYIMGDFNVHHKDWEKSSSQIDRQGVQLKLITDSMGLYQLIRQNTYFSGSTASLVDLLFVDKVSNVKSFEVGNLICEKHCPIICTLKNDTQEKILLKRNIYDYNSADVQQLNNFVQNHFHITNLMVMDVDECTTFIQKVLQSGLEKYVPHKQITVNKKDKLWMTDIIRQKMKSRDKLFKKHKTKKTAESWQEYKRARNEITTLIKEAKSRYLIRISKELEDPNKNNKSWHKTINSILKKSRDSTIPPLSYNNHTFFDNEGKAHVLNTFFCNKTKLEGYNEDVKKNITFRTNNRLSEVIFSQEIIADCISHLDCSKANGPDNISNSLIKLVSAPLSYALNILFNKIISKGHYPKDWKVAHVVPLYKTGDPSMPNNYRPISLLSNLSKIFEKIVYNQLYDYFTQNNLLSNNQSGFRTGDGTINRLAHFIDYCNYNISKGYAVPTVFLDISKAFDKVYHKGLLHKLKEMGISGKLFNLLKHYLSFRKQRVIIEGSASGLLNLFAGVPQGSVLGPLLFLVFINDIVDSLECLSSLFADDTSIYTSLKPLNNVSIHLLQSDLIKIESWAKQWKVSFNPDKTEMLVFSKTQNKPNIKLYFFGRQITVVHQHKHLGIILDDTMNWRPQIESLISKTQLNLNIMKHFKYIFSRKTLKIIYNYHVKSIISYGDILLGKLSIHLSKLLETIQYQALCTVSGCVRGTSEAKMREELGWNSLEECRFSHMACMIYKMINHLVPSYLSSLLPPFKQPINLGIHNLRPNINRIPDILTLEALNGSQFYLKSWLPQAISYWNAIPFDTRQSPSLNIFKNKLKIYLSIPKKMYYETGDRKLSSVYCQLRMGTNSLNASLFNRTLAISPNCSCGNVQENEKHYFLECENYQTQRNVLITSLTNLFTINNFQTYNLKQKLDIILKCDDNLMTKTVQLCTMCSNILRLPNVLIEQYICVCFMYMYVS